MSLLSSVLHQQTHSANDVNLFVALLFDLLEDVSTYLGMSAIIAIQTSNWHETNLGSIEDWISKENLAVRVNLPVGF